MGGTNKALLRINGGTIIEASAKVLKSIFPEILIITNFPDQFEFLNLPMHKDLIQGKGSLGGLYTGLRLCKGDRAFLAACDMPFLKAEIIRHMIRIMDDADVVIPRVAKGLEPLHAIYSKACLPHIEQLLTEGNFKFVNFFDKVKVIEICEDELLSFDPELRFIMNLNTPDDLEYARKIVAELQQD
jgi:molybdopterin-guanine dinucleotide biosynthesis protein A